MSSDLRLARLGLAHLKDRPDLLRATLEKQLQAERAKEDAWHQERQALLDALKQSERRPPVRNSTVGRVDPDGYSGSKKKA